MPLITLLAIADVDRIATGRLVGSDSRLWDGALLFASLVRLAPFACSAADIEGVGVGVGCGGGTAGNGVFATADWDRCREAASEFLRRLSEEPPWLFDERWPGV